MPLTDAAIARLTDFCDLEIHYDAPLSKYTRFAIGGPARILADTSKESSFIHAFKMLREAGDRVEVIGGGTNLVVADEGFDGVILRFREKTIRIDGTRVHVGAGAVLQDLVDTTIEHGLSGMHTMTGIPGWVGAALYGNAGAYGRSIDHSVEQVRFFDGRGVQLYNNAQCNFRYRESTFKDNKGWIIFSAELALLSDNRDKLREHADGIRKIRDAKYPPTMKCAGSIFKNLIFDHLPVPVQTEVDPKVIREGKVPSAWFLEQVGAKGMKNGDIHVADYHANLIYNAGRGTARQVREIIHELKRRVQDRFHFDLEEEVQYIG
jgi:UDP-N-acetylmuramate dehydrogenase